MSNILDGRYVGELTPEEVVKQFEYRIEIHKSYAGFVVQDPYHYPPKVYGDYEFHTWAINGYEYGIKYIKWNNPIRCTQAEAFATIFRIVVNLFRR